MTQQEKEEFLSDPHVGVLALNDGTHGPLTVPIWYDYQPGGELFFLTGPKSLKGKLLEVGVRVSLVAQTENPPYKYVSIEGSVVSIRTTKQDDLLKMAIRYLGSNAGKKYVESNSGDGGVLVRVTPDRWLAVDYSKP